MSIKFLIKLSACVATIVVLVTNIYIFTYPSVHPSACSWRCAATVRKSNIDTDDMSNMEKSLYYTKRYLADVKDQLFSTQGNKLKVTKGKKVPNVNLLAFGDPQIKGISETTPYRQRVDIFGNDYYLGHIYSMMKRRLDPTHVVVMGDLFSSQWISDSEYYNRTSRYMSRIFNRDTKLLEDIKNENHDEDGQYEVDYETWGKKMQDVLKHKDFKSFNFGYNDVYSWDPTTDDHLFINLTGNHDIGYSGDVSYQHLARYNELFGKDNFWIEYNTGTDHMWRIVVLNSMLLDGPALHPEMIDTNWEFLYQLFERRFEGSTVLLTHVPFYKPEGVCNDGPEFTYYPRSYKKDPRKGKTLRSQNHLTENTSRSVLNLIFDNDKPGIILTGHDHDGCETLYNKNTTSGNWKVSKHILSNYDLAIKEVTVKSMMGQFKGNTGLVTGTFDGTSRSWKWSYTLCPFTNEHAWWIAKGSTLVAGFLWSLYILV